MRSTLHDVEKNDVTELLEADQMGQRTANLPRANQCNFASRHRRKILEKDAPAVAVISPFEGLVQAANGGPTLGGGPNPPSPRQVSTMPLDEPDNCEWAAPCGRAR